MLCTRIFCSLSGLAVALVIGASNAAEAQTTALRGARVIDGRGGAPLDNATIVISDGRIVAIGASAETPVPSGAEVVDYTGKTIIPGLISAHSHVGIFVGLKAAPENYSRDIILRQLKQLEAYGVTTVMALGLNGPLFYELRPELHAGRIPGADLFGADQGVGVVGGQPSAAVVPVGENQVSRPGTAERARESVRQMAARKTDMVKIWLDGAGGLMPKVPPGSLFRRDRRGAQERLAGRSPHLRS
jgi:imidazolonepropionase-like amidohydrolase